MHTEYRDNGQHDQRNGKEACTQTDDEGDGAHDFKTRSHGPVQIGGNQLEWPGELILNVGKPVNPLQFFKTSLAKLPSQQQAQAEHAKPQACGVQCVQA